MTFRRSSPRARPRWLGLVALGAVLTVLGVSSALAAPSNYVEGADTNIRFNSVGTYDWGNSGPDRTVSANGTVTVNGTGGIFDGGIQGANNSTPPTPPNRTAASLADPQIVDADFTVDPLSSDVTTCGSGDPTTFGGAGSETNGGLLSTFTYGTSGNTPPKNDLSNVYALSRDGDGMSEIFFGAERVVNNGDSHIDFEFLQAEVTKLPSDSACAGTLSGNRTQGDLLLAIDFTNGGTFGGRTLYQWQCDRNYDAANDGVVCNPPASGKSVPHYEPVTNATVAAALTFGVNSGGAVAGGGWAHRNSDGSPRADVITNAFMEGAIDLTALGFDGCVQTLLPHTRSSQSFTAVLKDFALVSFDTCREPDITTQVKNTVGTAATADDTNVANGGSALVGDVLYDTASLSNATASAGGTVQYYVEKDDATCTVAGATNLGLKDVTNGVIPPSNDFTIAAAGTYYFWAVYSGDEKNAGDTSACNSELVVVVLEEPDVTTQVRNTNGDAADTDVADGATVSIPSTLYDTAALSESTAGAGGTATYYVQKQAALTGDPVCDTASANTTNLGAKTVANATIPASNTITLSSAGRYEFWVVYGGDPNNVGTSSTCGTETVIVEPNSPSASTILKNTLGTEATADDTTIADGATVTIPTTLYDTSSLTGATSDFGGSVTYYYQKQAALDGATSCATGTAIGGGTITAGTIPNSDEVTLDQTGRYEFWVVYSGDANNNTATSTCGDETVIVSPNAPTATTILMNTNGEDDDTSIPDGGSISIPSTLYDTATLSGETADAGGTATYYYLKQAALTGATVCDDTLGTSLGAKTVTGGVIPNSDEVTLDQTGRYEFWVVYSGDANNQGDTSECGTETVIVEPNSPSASTILKNTLGTEAKADDTTIVDGGSITIPSTIYDTSSLSGATADVSGTATYFYQKQVALQPTNCENGIQLGDAVAVTSSGIPDSETVTFDQAGTYEFWVVYSGDSNNNGDSSGCGEETVIVLPNSPVFDTQPEVQIRDVISLSGLTADATGDVTIKLFDPTNETCSTEAGESAPALSLLLDIEEDGSLSDGTWGFTTEFQGTAINGTWNWQISYSGDANNTSSTSACGVESVTLAITPDPAD